MPALVSSGVPQMNIALQSLKYFSSPIAPNRKSSWLNAYISAWRIFGSLNGGWMELYRNVYWFPNGFRSMSLMFGSASISGSRSWAGDSMTSISPFDSAFIFVC